MNKRSLRSRLRGRRTCGYGSRKKHRGKGSRGGMGMAGSGKKSGTKLTYLLRYFPGYLGRKKGFTSVSQKHNKKPEMINLDDINKKMHLFEKKGLLKKAGEGKELNLRGYKVLGSGKLNEKITIIADSFSKGAEEKIKSSGSKAVKSNEK